MEMYLMNIIYLVRLVPSKEAASDVLHCTLFTSGEVERNWKTHLLLIGIRREYQFCGSVIVVRAGPSLPC